MNMIQKLIGGAAALTVLFGSSAMASDWDLRDVKITPSLVQALNVAAMEKDTPMEEADLTTASVTSSASQLNKVMIVKQKLRDIIQTSANRSRLDVDISRGIRGVAQNVSLPAQLEPLLNELGNTYDVVWYRKNDSIFVSSSSENKSRLIFLGETSFKRFEKSIKEAGIIAPNFRIEYLSDAQSVSVVGPVSYLASLELIAEALGKSVGSASVVTIKAGVVNTIRR